MGENLNLKDVTLKYYFNEDELTETQITMIRLLSKQGFILAGDETLQRLIEQDYSSLRYKNAKEDMRKIGISINNQKKIDGVNTKVHKVGNIELFNMALELLKVTVTLGNLYSNSKNGVITIGNLYNSYYCNINR